MTSTYTLNVTSEFSAAHSVRGYEGRCARVHGHNYKIAIEVKATALDNLGFVIDYYAVKKVLQGVIEKLDHYNINDIKPFDVLNPTAENIAAWFYKSLAAQLNDEQISVVAVTLFETEDFSVRYTEA
jgi:6-pyruvoyltetrahydropterin/6-carboxytetrahydropterin synthase